MLKVCVKLSADPYETVNIIEQEPELALLLEAKILAQVCVDVILYISLLLRPLRPSSYLIEYTLNRSTPYIYTLTLKVSL